VGWTLATFLGGGCTDEEDVDWLVLTELENEDEG